MRLDDTASAGWLWKTAACGGCTLAALYLLGLVLSLVIRPYRAIEQGMGCQANLMRVTRGFAMYADDYDDRLPIAQGWMDRLVTYTDGEQRFHCPSVGRPGQPEFGYAMDPAVDGKARASIAEPASAALVSDSTDLTRSAVAGPERLPRPGRHVARGGRGQPAQRGNFVGYVGGSVAIRLDRSSGATGGGPTHGSSR